MRRLGPGDEALMTQLALSGPRFEEAGVDEPDEVPLPPADAATFLADDRTHLFVAYEDGGDDLLGFVVANELLHRHTSRLPQFVLMGRRARFGRFPPSEPTVRRKRRSDP